MLKKINGAFASPEKSIFTEVAKIWDPHQAWSAIKLVRGDITFYITRDVTIHKRLIRDRIGSVSRIVFDREEIMTIMNCPAPAKVMRNVLLVKSALGSSSRIEACLPSRPGTYRE